MYFNNLIALMRRNVFSTLNPSIIGGKLFPRWGSLLRGDPYFVYHIKIEVHIITYF